MVPRAGVEPARPFERGILSLIDPKDHNITQTTITNKSIAYSILVVMAFSYFLSFFTVNYDKIATKIYTITLEAKRA